MAYRGFILNNSNKTFTVTILNPIKKALPSFDNRAFNSQIDFMTKSYF